ncbi:MAG TPA: radical SAM protein [Anaerolineae bacterium]|nr:radical SAM protein [Anaerolineae bacterium]HMR64947.1 radical SAM protein [Anaerolineae bacterium]
MCQLSEQRDKLTKLYIEITAACNLDCQMCLRRTWHEPIGTMPLVTFSDLMEQVKALPSLPTLHLGGYGEPMAHPQFLEIVRLAKATGARVEMTSNGTLLNPEKAQALIDLDLNRLMVSIDGVTPEVYDDIRVRSSFNKVIENLRHLRRLKLRGKGRHSNPRVGIAFVAMKRNVADIPKLPQLATYVGAHEIMISNVVPHHPEMEAEILYGEALTSAAYRASRWVPNMSLPKLDMNAHTLGALGQVFDSTVSLSVFNTSLSAMNDYCRFAQEGYAVIRWDGQVSPCLPLLHDHTMYLFGREKRVTHYGLGNITEQPLGQVWQSPEFSQHRTRLREFPFSPCTTCGGCERFPANYVDCSHNTFPVCGGCLWAQGFVQCP